MFQNDLYNLFVFLGCFLPIVVMAIILFSFGIREKNQAYKDIRYIKELLDKAKDDLDITFEKMDK